MPAPASVVTIAYEDLISFDPSSTTNPTGRERLVEQIGAAFGPHGLGLLAVSDVPDFSAKRQALLPLAAQLPTLPDLPVDPASLYSVGWSHGKEELTPGQPDMAKGSYYANPLTEDLAQALEQRDGSFPRQQAAQHPEFYAPNVWPASLPALRTAFCDMGRLLQQVGIRVAAVCDEYCRRNGVPTTNLQRTIEHSLNSKGRLLHYFSSSEKNSSSQWCAWHNDHGSLTGLVPGMFLDANGQPVACPDPERSGLFVQARSGGPPVKVHIPVTDCCAFQIGESSQIVSGGLLLATPHAVLCSSSGGATRESFAVFLEPEFGAPLEVPAGKTIEDCQGVVANPGLKLPPLKARWKPGQTFGDFHLATVSAFAVTD